ncbi:MAG: TolC family protein [Candidatus Velthaea sp.]
MHKRARFAMAALGLVLVLAGVPALADAPPAAPLSLDMALALALDRNPGYRIAHTGVIASRARLHQAAAPRLPAVAVRDTLAYASPVAKLSTPLGTLPFSTTTTTNVPLLTLEYHVFDGGITAARVSQAAAELAAADAQERAARMSLIDTTTRAYFDLVAALQSAAVGDRAVDVSQSHVRVAQQLFSAGQVPRADVLRAQTELANERVQSLGSHNAVALAQTVLDNALGVPLGDMHQPTDGLDAGAPDVALDTLLNAARTQRGDVAAAQSAVEAAEYALKEVRAGRAPQINVAIANGNVQPAIAPGYRNQFSVALSAVWTLFDNGSSAGRVEAAQAGIDRSRLTLEQLHNDVELQVRQAYLNLIDAKARAGAALSYVALADENLRLAQVRYRGGVGTVLELQDAELRASAARRTLIAAQVAVREGIVHVRFTAGLL